MATVDDSQKNKESTGSDAVRRRERAMASFAAGTAPLVMPRPRRRWRRRIVLSLSGLVLIAIGAGLFIIANQRDGVDVSVTQSTPPVALVAQGSSTVLVGQARPGSRVSIALLSTHVDMLADNTGTWNLPVPLFPGINRFTATYTDLQGQSRSTTYLVTFRPLTTTTPSTTVVARTTTPNTTPATTAPASTAPTTVAKPTALTLSITSPADGTRVATNRVVVIGKATPAATVTAAGLTTTADPAGAWSLTVTVLTGANHLQFTVTAPNAAPYTTDLLIVLVPPTTTSSTADTVPRATTTTCCPPDTLP